MNDSRNLLKSFLLILFVMGIPVSFGFYYFYKRQQNLLDYLELISKQEDKEKIVKQIELLKEEIPGKSVANSWLDVQKKVKDTVVQVFSQVAMFNWLEPYKSPRQYESAGSAFFIDSTGHLITNFHVISEASSIQIQIPSFGRERFDVEVVGVYPDKDIALLKLTEESFEKIKQQLNPIPYLSLGNSDIVLRTQEVLALGYPLGQERLKSTLGIVSGREALGFIQITAPINPGSSGGPSINSSGEVIGINFAGVIKAQNVGYIIPINEVKEALKDLEKVKLLRKPILGCIFTAATTDMVSYFGNPPAGGWHIAKVFDKTLLDRIGVKADDMLYMVNGHKLDLYGEMSVPWSEDKISLLDYLNRFTVGDDMYFVIYRHGKRYDFKFKLDDKYLPPIRKIYPEFEPELIDYEIIGGMVVMPLSLNHVALMLEVNPGLAKYVRPETQHDSVVVITHVFPDSMARKARILNAGAIIEEVNGEEVKTLNDFRKAVLKSKKDGYLTVKTEDKMFSVLSMDKVLKDEDRLSSRYFYRKSKLLDEIK